MKRIIVGIAAVVIILAAVIIMRMNKTEQFAQPISDPVVEAVNPDYGDVMIESAVVGTISNEESVTISIKAGGDITEVYIKAGDEVEEGQLLFTIDTKQVETAKNSLDSAALTLKQAREDLSRMSVLYSGGGISSQSYQQYVDAVESAEIAYSNAQITYDNQLSYANVVSPLTGRVESVDVDKLDTVSQGFEACVISGGKAKNVSFSVSERVVENLALGDEITIEKDKKTYEGNIIEISTMVDENTGLFTVKARLNEENDNSSLPTGSMVKLTLVSEKSLNVLRVPVDSVYYDGGLSYVYTYDPDGSILHKVEVETGIYNSEYMEIISGITEDDLVLITWTSELYEGVSVRLKGSDTESSTVTGAEAPAEEPADADEAA